VLKQRGSSEASRLLRQERVSRYLLRGVGIREIAQQESVSERTIQRDAEEIKFSLMQIIQLQQLRTHRLALAELDEIWRELWVLYHRPPRDVSKRQGNEMVFVKEDDRPIKTSILLALARVSDEKNRLILQVSATPFVPSGVQTIPQNAERVVADFIDTLPDKLRGELFGILEQRTGVPEKDT
jgi:transposase